MRPFTRLSHSAVAALTLAAVSMLLVPPGAQAAPAPPTIFLDTTPVAPTGRTFRVRMCAVFEFDDEGLVCERVYFNPGDIVSQLSQGT